VLLPITVSADYYKYVDKNGGIHYVDDMSKVPEEYQNDVHRHIVPESSAESGPDASANTGPKIPPDVQKTFQKETSNNQKEAVNKKNTQKEGIKPSKSDLSKRKKELEEEYDSLMKEKEELSESIRQWSKRYKTRRRKSVARAKLKQLKEMEMEWDEKYKAWEKKKIALENN
jgi:hypothetical protein